MPCPPFPVGVVRQCATLFGARALFEQGGRTDPVLPRGHHTLVCRAGMEARTDINEISKPLERTENHVFQIFIG